MTYRYYPNNLAREMFGLRSEFYENVGLTRLLEDCLGKENYRKYVPAQDPLCGKLKDGGEINIIVNPDEQVSNNWIFTSIGKVQFVPEH